MGELSERSNYLLSGLKRIVEIVLRENESLKERLRIVEHRLDKIQVAARASKLSVQTDQDTYCQDALRLLTHQIANSQSVLDPEISRELAEGRDQWLLRRYQNYHVKTTCLFLRCQPNHFEISNYVCNPIKFVAQASSQLVSQPFGLSIIESVSQLNK